MSFKLESGIDGTSFSFFPLIFLYFKRICVFFSFLPFFKIFSIYGRILTFFYFFLIFFQFFPKIILNNLMFKTIHSSFPKCLKYFNFFFAENLKFMIFLNYYMTLLFIFRKFCFYWTFFYEFCVIFHIIFSIFLEKYISAIRL